MIRKPIVLSKNTVAWIQIFKKHDDIEDVMYGVWDEENGYDGSELWKKAAKEFISQLKNQSSPSFLKALIEECQNVLEGE